MADMAAAGRARPARGEDHPRAKLLELEVLAIYNSDETSAELARAYGVSESMIRFIRTGQSWSWLTKAHIKTTPFRSKDYRRRVSELSCAHCGRPGPSQVCHVDMGKGMGIKTSDYETWPGCADTPMRQGCHSIIGSSGKYNRDERRKLEREYAAKTRETLKAAV
jgi:hypothetical protein